MEALFYSALGARAFFGPILVLAVAIVLLVYWWRREGQSRSSDEDPIVKKAG